MKNDYFVHSMREALIQYRRSSIPTSFPPWIKGFFASFVHDCDSKEYDGVEDYQSAYSTLPDHQLKSSFDLGFSAGLLLRSSAEEIQKNYPEKVSEWDKLKQAPLS